MDYEEVLKFWFEELTPPQWWKKDPQLDIVIKEKFFDLYEQACVGELYQWRASGEGRLAEIIILDQFSRNMFRGSAQAFATDAMALILSQEAIRAGQDVALSDDQRNFLYMPFMHSESVAMHKLAKKLFESVTSQSSVESAKQHYAIIKRFGRYPHRNQLLWRESSEEEMDFLEQPGSSF
ncbi:MAG: hypothetical protein ACI9ES_003195 [Oceanospirillaceae bacterium]|jgi:uncharacterized protein (DUF924 family)